KRIDQAGLEALTKQLDGMLAGAWSTAKEQVQANEGRNNLTYRLALLGWAQAHHRDNETPEQTEEVIRTWANEYHAGLPEREIDSCIRSARKADPTAYTCWYHSDISQCHPEVCIKVIRELEGRGKSEAATKSKAAKDKGKRPTVADLIQELQAEGIE